MNIILSSKIAIQPNHLKNLRDVNDYSYYFGYVAIIRNS